MNICERVFCRSRTCVNQVLIGVALKKSNTLIFGYVFHQIWGATDHDGVTPYKSNGSPLSLLF